MPGESINLDPHWLRRGWAGWEGRSWLKDTDRYRVVSFVHFHKHPTIWNSTITRRRQRWCRMKPSEMDDNVANISCTRTRSAGFGGTRCGGGKDLCSKGHVGALLETNLDPPCTRLKRRRYTPDVISLFQKDKRKGKVWRSRPGSLSAR